MADEPHESEDTVELSESERDEVEDRGRPRAAVLHETIRAEGEEELERPASALFWSALAAGLSMGFSLVAMAAIHEALPDTPWRHLVVALGYAFGFVIVIMGRQQLFTENTLTPVLPLLHHFEARTAGRLLRLWGVVLVANVIGTLVVAAVLAKTSVFPESLKTSALALADHAMQGSAAVHFLRAIFAGWLIALIVWILPAAEQSRVFVIVAFTYLIGVAGLSHVIAGSVEAGYGVFAGSITAADFVGRFFLPVLIGNVLGGVSLVAALAHAQVMADEREKPAE